MRETALITGASGGIGYELARKFAFERKNLILVARDLGKLVELKEKLEKTAKVEVMLIDLDLSHSSSSYEVYNRVKMNNIKVDYLINNAGVGCYGTFSDTDWQKEESMINLNITALTHLTKLFMKDMIKRKKGRIMNVASTAAFQPGPFMSVYFATKGYVLLFTEALAYELKNTGVTITAFCPGATESGFKDSASMGKSGLFKKGKKIPTSQEVAEYGYKIMMKGRKVSIHGIMNNLLVFSTRFAPRSWVTAIAGALTRPVK